jgi:hypothetical protein
MENEPDASAISPREVAFCAASGEASAASDDYAADRAGATAFRVLIGTRR